MRLRAVIVLAAMLAADARAHPGTGIAVDDAGRVYYTDLAQIRRIDGGRDEVVVADVHTHDFALAAGGVLVGEETRHLGGDRYEHRRWTRAADGTVGFERWQAGFWPDQGVRTDAARATYWTSCPGRACTVWRAAADGARQRLYDAPAGARLGALHVTAAGRVVVVQGDTVQLIDLDGSVRELAGADQAQRFGLWADDCGNVLSTSYAARRVGRRTADGAWSTAHASDDGWAPTGVAVSASGDVWVLEYSPANAARATRAALRMPPCG